MKDLLHTLALILVLSSLFVTGCRTTEETDVEVSGVKVSVPVVQADVDVPGVDVSAVDADGPGEADVGSQGPVGPNSTDVELKGPVGTQGRVGPGAGIGLIFGVDWVYVVASALVLVALAVGLAIGRGPRG